MKDIHLFINDSEIEFSKDPQILFNYKMTDISNPTAIKNSYTKSITVEGTNRNNKIFSNIWRLDYYYNGGGFNPLAKSDFRLYVNGDLVETGYAKLDKIVAKNNNVEYTITLYGGLGSFFWNLSHNGDKSMKLSDLDYGITDLDFVINKETIWDAWNTLEEMPNMVTDPSLVDRPSNYLYSKKWDLINFCPSYNGTPNNLDCSKVLINTHNLDLSLFENPKEGYTLVQGYLLGESGDELTEWETRDLRSYLQRPVVNMRKVIEACTQPQNNGGWEVFLDEHFFNEENPYWTNAWMTLPMLSEMNLDAGEEREITDCTLTKITRNKLRLSFDEPTDAKFNNLNFEIRPRFDFDDSMSSTKDILHGHSLYSSTGGFTLQRDMVKKMEDNSGVTLQLFAYDGNDKVIGQSKAYILCESKEGNLGYSYDANGADKEYIMGNWKRDTDGKYYFADNEGNFKTIKFYLTSQVTFDHLALAVYKPNYRVVDYKGYNIDKRYAEDYSVVYLYENDYFNSNVWHTLSTIEKNNYLGRVRGDYSFDIVSFSLTSTDYDKFISGSKITKDKILATEGTPCDYLLSYCKMFGLYFYCDPAEVSDNETAFPMGVIHIMDRDTFYKRNEVVDLNSLIDRSKNLQITPQTATTKYYRFGIEQNESEASDEYMNTYDKEYGEQVVNTNYEFDSDKTDLYENSVFKGGITVWEKDKYYNNTPSLPSYMYNGFTYSYFKKSDEGTDYSADEHSMSVQKFEPVSINVEDMPYFDAFPKLQCHTEDNDSSDGGGVLLFFNYAKSTLVNYALTDDIRLMATINDETPCWIATQDERDVFGNRIAYIIHNMPYFSREIIDENKIYHSWDFSGSQVVYLPDTYNTEDMGIYDKCWKAYIKDMYDVNSRKLTCFVKLLDRPSPDWLRRFYFFDNAIWRLNAITDWNVASYGTTKMEFFKVQDIENYALDRIRNSSGFYCVPSASNISQEGGRLFVYVHRSDGGNWYVEPDLGMLIATDGERRYAWPIGDVCSPTSGYGNQTLTLNIPANEKGKKLTYTLHITDDDDKWISCTFTQSTYEEYLNVDKTVLLLDYDDGAKGNINITSNLNNYKIEMVNDDEYIDVNKNQLTLDYDNGARGNFEISSNAENYDINIK